MLSCVIKIEKNTNNTHGGLNGYTPAHFANIYLDLGDKKWEKLLMQSLKYYNEEVR